MALPILDGNQSATTLSTILSSGQHITAHTVVSLGNQAITDIVNATSAGLTNTQLRASPVTVGGTVTVGNSVTISSLPAISGTVTLGAGTAQIGSVTASISNFPATQPVSIASVTIGSLPSNATGFFGDGKNNLYELFQSAALNIGFISDNVPIGSLPAGTAQIGSVTASISNSVTIGSLPAIFADPSGFQTVVAGISDVEVNTIRSVLWIPQENGSDGEMLSQTNPLPISGTVTVGNSVTISSLPAISGTVTANTFALQGTAVTTSNFTSTTASTVLANFNATREVLTIFSEGPGTLFVSAGATCTTAQYQVRLSSGDYYEVPNHQTTITHSAVFATAGTARVTEVS